MLELPYECPRGCDGAGAPGRRQLTQVRMASSAGPMPPRIHSGKAWKLSDVRVPAAVLRCHATDVDDQAAAGIEADEDGLVRVD